MPTLLVQYTFGPRVKIDIVPNKPLLAALEDACEKRSLDPSKYIFVHNKKPVDLSLTFRLSGLVNNANVDLIPKPAQDGCSTSQDVSSNVCLCFRLEQGQRVYWSGSPRQCIWSILSELSLTSVDVAKEIALSDSPSNGFLTVVHVHDEIIGLERLRSTGPASLGITRGSVLFQLRRSRTCPEVKKSTERTKTPESAGQMLPIVLPTTELQNKTASAATAAASEMSDDGPFPGSAITAATAAATSVTESTTFVSPFSVFAERPTRSAFGQPACVAPSITSNNENRSLGDLLGISLDPTRDCRSDHTVLANNEFADFKFPTETAGKDLRKQLNDGDEQASKEPIDREWVVFRYPSADNSGASCEVNPTEELPDEFFTVTEEDLRKVLHFYRMEGSSSQPLQTAAMRKASRDQFYQKYSRAIIHFQWSDGVVVQACFGPLELVSSLYRFVREHLRSPTMEFTLYTTPPRVVLQDQTKNLVDANLVPLSKVYFSGPSSKAEDVLASEVYSAATPANMSLANVKVQSWMGSFSAASHVQSSKEPSDSTVDQEAPSDSTRRSGYTPVPKWMKLGK